MEEKKVTREYSNDEVTVVWKSKLCIHSEKCFHGMSKVFNPNQRPWIKVDAATTDEIINQIRQCPSGALSFYMNADGWPDEKTGGGVLTDRNTPAVLELEKGKTYAWCSCSLSKNQPFCDGSHKTTEKRPVVFENQEIATKALCMCKKTGNSPYCDGSHAR